MGHEAETARAPDDQTRRDGTGQAMSGDRQTRCGTVRQDTAGPGGTDVVGQTGHETGRETAIWEPDRRTEHEVEIWRLDRCPN